jgi:hypothetical protein
MMLGGLYACPDCGKRHRITSMVPDPDNPDRMLCPVRSRGVFRLSGTDREKADRLLRDAFEEAT